MDRVIEPKGGLGSVIVSVLSLCNCKYCELEWCSRCTVAHCHAPPRGTHECEDPVFHEATCRPLRCVPPPASFSTKSSFSQFSILTLNPTESERKRLKPCLHYCICNSVSVMLVLAHEINSVLFMFSVSSNTDAFVWPLYDRCGMHAHYVLNSSCSDWECERNLIVVFQVYGAGSLVTVKAGYGTYGDCKWTT